MVKALLNIGIIEILLGLIFNWLFRGWIGDFSVLAPNIAWWGRISLGSFWFFAIIDITYSLYLRMKPEIALTKKELSLFLIFLSLAVPSASFYIYYYLVNHFKTI